jgi:hypothetical protein
MPVLYGTVTGLRFWYYRHPWRAQFIALLRIAHNKKARHCRAFL